MNWNPFPAKQPPRNGKYAVAFLDGTGSWDWEMCRWDRFSGWMGDGYQADRLLGVCLGARSG